MRYLITGIAGFAGSTLAEAILAQSQDAKIVGLDNFVRPGSEVNRRRLADMGIEMRHGDIRSASDLETIPAVDYVIDAAANPSVLAGIDGRTSSRQLVEHNLLGTVNLLEFCKTHHAGFILLSTSRVYSIEPLQHLEYSIHREAFLPSPDQKFPRGISAEGISETYSSEPPLSLYGATKLASEQLALEYGRAFDFPVWINRCGVLAGAGQFGRPDQGIFAYWIHSYRERAPLRYIGFEGKGYQVRDCLHPRDVASLILRQTNDSSKSGRIFNISGGSANSISLRQLSDWCAQRFPEHKIDSDPVERPFDIPWMVLNPTQAARELEWSPETNLNEILEEIADHAEKTPDWLRISAA